jgi:hypothetical protein
MNPRKALFEHFNYFSMFALEPNRRVFEVLGEKGPPAMILELERLASLGSAWAAATLAYLCLLRSPEGVRHPERAEELCSKAAMEGDPYALFILGWARFYLKQSRDRVGEPVLRSSQMRFAPANLSMAIFVWPNTELMLRFLNEATMLGHKGALSLRCGLYRTGRFGIARKIVGWVLMPFARARYVFALWRDPFSESVMWIQPTDERPTFHT